MSMESIVRGILAPLVSDRVFPDFAPNGTAVPYITYQAIGGAPINYTDPTIPDRENTRLQVNVWAATRLGASALGKQAEDAMRVATGLQVEVLTGRTATNDDATQYRGTLQDFSIWY